MIDLREFEIQGEVNNLKQDKLEESILHALNNTLRAYDNARGPIVDIWRRAYYAYSTTKSGKSNMTAVAKQEVGRVKTNWRHNLKSPKAFETVETIVSYMMASFFPNQKWFDYIPATHSPDPDLRYALELTRRHVSDKLDDSKFKETLRMTIRDVAITGIGGFLYPWDSSEQNSEFSVIPCFNLWLDPKAQHINCCNIIRKYTMGRVDILVAHEEFFDLADSEKLSKLKKDWSETGYRDIRYVNGIAEDLTHHDVDVYEFWGDLTLEKEQVIFKNVRANFTKDGCLLNFMANPYHKKPVALFNYLQTSANPYGISCLQPILPQLYYKDVMSSRHADSVVASVDSPYEVVVDGVERLEDVVFEPGKIIPVTQPNTIRPIQTGGRMDVSIQDMSIVEQTIDKATGTGPYIGVGAGRSGERVTAEEIKAQVNAGGNRLTDIYAHLELYLLDFLGNFRKYFQMYMMYPEASYVNYGGKQLWAEVNPQLFDIPVKVKPLGALNVATKEFALRQTFDWMSVVGQNPEMAQKVNWSAVLDYVTYTMLPDQAEQFLAMPQQQPMPQPQDPMQQAQGMLQEAGLGAEAKMLQSDAMAGILPQTLQQITPTTAIG